MFSVGIILGAVYVNSESVIIEKLSVVVDSYTSLKAEQGIGEIFLNSCFSNLLFVFTNIFFSFSLIGYPVIFFIPLLKGLGIGSVCGYLYATYKLSGLGYTLLTILPGTVVSAFALIMASYNGCEYSKNAYLKAISGKGQFEKGETKIFLLRQLLFIGICVVSSFIDSLLSLAFLRFFEF